jgi:vancomycin permeability regulator SanA
VQPDQTASGQPAQAHPNAGIPIDSGPLSLLGRQKWRIVSIVLVICAILYIPSEAARQSTKDIRYGSSVAEIQNLPAREVGIVFGAGVLPDRTPTEYLKHRIETAVDVYKSGHVKRLMMSGDNRTSHYNEPVVMKDYAITLGVSPADIDMDYAGYSTYDTCHRAHAVFKITSATVVTQGYHLPRAVMTCKDIGIDTIGVAAKSTGRDWTVNYLVREHAATIKAYVQIATHSKSMTTTVTETTTTTSAPEPKTP